MEKVACNLHYVDKNKLQLLCMASLCTSFGYEGSKCLQRHSANKNYLNLYRSITEHFMPISGTQNWNVYCLGIQPQVIRHSQLS